MVYKIFCYKLSQLVSHKCPKLLQSAHLNQVETIGPVPGLDHPYPSFPSSPAWKIAKPRYFHLDLVTGCSGQCPHQQNYLSLFSVSRNIQWSIAISREIKKLRPTREQYSFGRKQTIQKDVKRRQKGARCHWGDIEGLSPVAPTRRWVGQERESSWLKMPSRLARPPYSMPTLFPGNTCPPNKHRHRRGLECAKPRLEGLITTTHPLLCGVHCRIDPTS